MESKTAALGNFPCAILVIVVSAVHWILSRLAVQFRGLFAGFASGPDAQLPALTRLMLSDSIVFWPVPGFALLLIVLNRAAIVPKSVVIIATVLTTLASIAVFGIAMYLPVLHLGAIVQ